METTLGRQHLYVAEGGGALGPWAVLHGVGSHATAYGGLLSRLKPHVGHLVAPDLPGHGLSEGPEDAMTAEAMLPAVEAALAAQCAEPMILLGCSLGGALAVRLAVRGNIPVRALVLCAPAGGPLAPDRFAEFLTAFQLDRARAARAFTQRLFERDRWFAALAAPLLQGEFQRPSIRAFFRQLSPEDQFTPEIVTSLDIPVLVMWGAGERLLWAEHRAYYQQHLPARGRLVEIEGAGHSIHLERPDALVEQAVAFARERL